MEKLAESLEASSGGKFAKDIRQTLAQLNQEWSRLDNLWSSRNSRLEEGLQFQKWNKEADRIDATIAGHEARLKNNELGVRSSVFKEYFKIQAYARGAVIMNDMLRSRLFL